MDYPTLVGFDAAFLKYFAPIHDLETAEMLSRACGEFTALGYSLTESSGSTSGRVTNSLSHHQSNRRQPRARRLIKPEGSCSGCTTTSRSC
jgi:type IV secretory pathway TraG/TraD family ATPase VirD4